MQTVIRLATETLHYNNDNEKYQGDIYKMCIHIVTWTAQHLVNTPLSGHPTADTREGSLLRNNEICFYHTMSQIYSSRKDDCLYQRIIQIIQFKENSSNQEFIEFLPQPVCRITWSMCWQI